MVGILLALQIAVVVVAYFFYDNIVGTLNTQLAKGLTTSYNSNFTSTGDYSYDYVPGNIISKGVDAIQVEVSTNLALANAIRMNMILFL